MTDQSNRILSELPQRLHHNAYVCSNQERTRQFYEDVIGLPLLATWVEEAEFPQFPGKRLAYSHTFYGIGDGGALAFFEFPDPEAAALYGFVRGFIFFIIHHCWRTPRRVENMK